MKISIITATYNSEKYIQQCVQSIASQTWRDIEHIIVDSVSTDKTIEKAKEISSDFVLISGKDNGIYDALNKGINSAKGDVIGFLHSDDFFENENVLEKIANAFSKTGAEAVYGNLKYVSADNTERIVRLWKSKPFKRKNLKYGWMPAHTTFFVKKEIYEKYGLYDTCFRIASDYDLMMRYLGMHHINVHYLDEFIVCMRTGGASNKVGNYFLKWKEDYRAIRRNNIGGFYTLVFKDLRKLRQFLY